MTREPCDVLVIGSGIAGLTFALQAARHGDVVLVTKKERAASNTNYAQGGIAAVMADDDSAALHARDTFVAGAGLCHTRAVRTLVREGPARVQDLLDWGVQFTRDRTRQFSLGREGGHSRRRILHADDLTGREIERALLDAIAAEPRVRLLEDHLAVDLFRAGTGAARRCRGALVLDHATDRLIRYDAKVVMLATGGLGQAYLHTTNPDIATGDGVAMAYRAGAEIANLEFVQFHPTALYPAGERAFLISEAVRGEGAVLMRPDGRPLMEGVHALGSLAPRDVVAREIDAMMKETGAPHALLDLTAIGADRIERRFPGIHAECARRGIDIRSEPAPVVPAAHYACGGIRTDSVGRSSLPGLFAAGEVACTGVHGANRLASNSLLEAVVYSYRAAQVLPDSLRLAERSAGDDAEVPDRPGGDGVREPARWRRLRQQLRTTLWDDAGLVRRNARLMKAAAHVTELSGELAAGSVRDPDFLEARNLIEVAGLIVASACQRAESRGLHYNVDFPFRDNERHLRDTRLVHAGW